MAASTILHAALIATAAFVGTKEIVDRVGPIEPDRLIYIAAPKPVPSAPAAAGSPGAVPQAPPLDVPRVVLPAIAPALDHFVVTRLDDITPGGSTVPLGAPSLPGPGGGNDRIFTANTVDREVTPHPGNRSPSYPEGLRAAGVAGEVVARFVVDTAGRVEPGSIEIAAATHALFAQAVERWLVRTRYSPAQAGGVRVRQRVEQRINFSLR